uniref:Uncharacterized protein n=1 Tax=Zea mays TaxID=4577 RepID=B7ZYJ6_MAIZE|nr:unknown [Zea mays]
MLHSVPTAEGPASASVAAQFETLNTHLAAQEETKKNRLLRDVTCKNMKHKQQRILQREKELSVAETIFSKRTSVSCRKGIRVIARKQSGPVAQLFSQKSSWRPPFFHPVSPSASPPVAAPFSPSLSLAVSHSESSASWPNAASLASPARRTPPCFRAASLNSQAARMLLHQPLGIIRDFVLLQG